MLVVEDDPRSRKLLEGYLRTAGYSVRGAPDGSTALEMARQEVPDVVLLDVMMPGMTGHEVCQQLKSDQATRLCQVMMVTALAATPDKVCGLDTGADDYTTKPVRREEFLAKVRALVRARRLLRDLERAHADLTARNDELQLKKTLAQTLVHDLKSPLSQILGNLDLLEMRCESELQYLIERAKRGTSRMQRMILDLLDVEALEEGKFVPEIERLDLARLVREAIDEAQVSVQGTEIRLDADIPDEMWALGDPTLIRRVVDNLVANAINHTPGSGTVEVIVCPRQEGIEVAVIDSGPGVPEAYREQVFEKYAQLNMKESGVTANRGLGLTFCRLAIEAQGGTIWVEDAPAGGACFRAILADACQESPAVPAGSAAAEG